MVEVDRGGNQEPLLTEGLGGCDALREEPVEEVERGGNEASMKSLIYSVFHSANICNLSC